MSYPRPPIAERILRYDEDPETGCWIWRQFKLRGDGYGLVRVKGKWEVAHRVAYELMVGPIPEGLTLDHLCRRPSCINPIHLEPVTIRENVLRGNGMGAINARKTHCKRGHAFDAANTQIRERDSARLCRTCRTAAWKARQLAKAE